MSLSESAGGGGGGFGKNYSGDYLNAWLSESPNELFTTYDDALEMEQKQMLAKNQTPEVVLGTGL